MRAVELRKSGKPQVLKISRVADPQPGKGEVLVRLHYAGINYAEILSRKGLYGWAPKRPYIPGMEGTGEIIAVGAGVDSERIGEKVMIGAQYGCYAEKIVVASGQALPAIAGYSAAESAAFLVNYMTAWVALAELGRMRSGEKVLITAAAGGVGTAAVQLAVANGCEVYGLAGSEEKLERLRRMGVAAAFNYRHTEVFKKLRETAGGIDVVLEVVGGEIYRNSLDLLNPFGRMVVVGYASLDLHWWNPLSWYRSWRDIPRANIMKMAEQSIGVHATHLGYLLKDAETMQSVYERLVFFVKQHDIRPVIGAEYPLDKVAAAHAFIESRQSVGKVVLNIGE